jgi:pyruvate kinase
MQTEILATIGPSSSERLDKMIEKGLSGIRINSSHGTIEEHARIIKSYRGLTGRGFIVYDIKGPKIRIGDLPGPLHIKSEMHLTLNSKLPVPDGSEYPRVSSFEEGIPVTFPIDRYVKKNDRLFVDDGYVCLSVMKTEPGKTLCRVMYGDKIKSRKGLNHPDTHIDFPYTTSRDVTYIEFAKRIKVDFIADSYTRNETDVAELRQHLKNTSIKIISKIESEEAILSFDRILSATDAIMIARGDLGIEIEPWRLPEYQKIMISACNKAGKPVITATQMLESMVYNPFPSRADVSDVANALYDGTDVVMLSEETSVGKYPVECVEMMHEIDSFVQTTERYRSHKTRINALSEYLHESSPKSGIKKHRQ